MARPRKDIDQKQFEGLCTLQCTQEEMCGFFDVDDMTLNAWCKRTYKMSFSEVFKRKRGTGRISLRRHQWKMAETNPTMAIFLGKQFLGQSDNPVADQETVKDDGFLKALAGTAESDWTEDEA